MSNGRRAGCRSLDGTGCVLANALDRARWGMSTRGLLGCREWRLRGNHGRAWREDRCGTGQGLYENDFDTG